MMIVYDGENDWCLLLEWGGVRVVVKKSISAI